MPTTKKHSILIVDDEPDVLFSLTGLLRREFQVYTAASGAEALQIMSEHPVHVVMTDQRMPVMTGGELMQKVRHEHPEAIRIVFTGYADTRTVVEAINSGELYRYITKPWDPEDLIEVLHQAAEKHDAIIAESDLLHELESYLDDASRLAAAADTTTFGPEFLLGFQSRTEKIRGFLERAEMKND